jgi:hypothetical protein
MALYEPLVNESYFEGEMQIGQLESLAVRDELRMFIRRHEYDFLVKALGLPLYEAFYTGMQGATVDQRWLDLAYGKRFILDASKVKTASFHNLYGVLETIPRTCYEDKMQVNYRGLLKVPEDYISPGLVDAGYGATSPLCKYIYWHWHRSKLTAVGGVAESVQTVHNGTIAPNNFRLCQLYNEMSDSVIAMYHFLDQHAVDYPEFDLQPKDRFNPRTVNPYNFLS